jgi:outer membrane protein assembly factor BamB
MKLQRTIGSLIVVAVSCLGNGPVAHSADARWPQFRGPNGNGVAEESGVPIEFGPQKNVLWKTPVPEGHSSPVIWSDRIFLTAFDEGRLETICLDRITGGILWRRTAGERKKLRKGHPTNSRASSTPATDGKRVFVYFGPIGLVAYDFDGNEKWRMPVPAVKQPWGVGTSPIVAGARVLLNIDYDIGSFLVAVDAATGKTIWKAERAEFRRGWSTPLVLPDDNQVVVAGSLRLVAYDLISGHEVWTVKGLPYQVSPSPVLADDMLYFAAWDAGGFGLTFDAVLASYDKDKDEKITFQEHNFGYDHPKFDRDKDGFVTRPEFDGFIQFMKQSRPALLAIRPGGEGNVTDTHVKWESSASLPHIPSVLAYRDLIYTVRNGGIVTCYDAKTGRQHYRSRIPAPGNHYASPTANDGKIYFASQKGAVVVVKAGPTMEVLAINKIAEPVFASPAFVDRKIYLRTGKHLYAFEDRAFENAKLIADFNRRRESLGGVFQHDFASDGLPNDRFAIRGIANATHKQEDGVRVVAPGSDTWKGSYLYLRRALRGDFDLTLRFETLKLEKPARGSSGVFFEVRLGKEPGVDAYAAVSGMNAGGIRLVQTTMVTTNDVGKRTVQGLGNIKLASVDQLRLVRRGEVLYLLCAAPGSEEFHLVSQRTAGTDDVPVNGVRMYVRTSGAGLETITVWKQLDIRADEVRTNEASKNAGR